MWYYSVETELSYPICTSRRKRRIRSHVSIALAVFISAIFVIGVLLTGALSYSDGLDELRTSNPSPVHDAFAGCNGDDACCLAVGGSAWKSHKLSTAFVKMSDGTQLAIRVATKTSGLESIPVMKAGTWDSELLQNVIDSLAAFGSSSVLFDIGTHTAWFSLVAAYLGHRAITFESSESNRAVMGHSLCLASLEVQRRVVILPHELGARDDDTRTRALDSILINNEVVLRQGEQVVMKLENGNEPFAIMGASEFLRFLRPPLIYCDYAESKIEQRARSLGWSKSRSNALPEEFLRTMKDAGYNASTLNNLPIHLEQVTFTRIIR